MDSLLRNHSEGYGLSVDMLHSRGKCSAGFTQTDRREIEAIVVQKESGFVECSTVLRRRDALGEVSF